ncbi:glycine N-acyltransferase-like isoform X2 [Epinephelus fuscoguttatus]|uniref:glycine N-acyltransferase-like isoform X2 n=1 Tax=Epinephelus fuscoguttatus TaxID=293821 RepID=UPI0020D1E438|nr:glycine N-acyltransferase-like isoform X2 [Epinephelus fuscoguttatus]
MNFNRMIRTAYRPFLFAHMERKGVGASFRFTQTTRHLMELTGEQLKLTEIHLKRYLPQSQQAYGCLVLRNRVTSDPVRVLVDRWPEFNVIVCKPKYEQKGDLFKTTVVFAKDEAVLEETLRKSSVIDWTQYLCVDINLRHVEVFKAVAREKGVFSSSLTVSHMTIPDVSNLPSVDSSGISLGSLDESHVDLVNQMWRYGRNERTVRMIRNMVANFPSCCVLDAEGKPVSWILTFASCAMGVLHTLPEHRGKGYAKVVINTLAKRLHAQGYPVYGFREEENEVTNRLLKSMGFGEVPSHREACIVFNEF